jgi:RNA recognition motif-containing protein
MNMSNKMYVGNLPFSVGEAELREAFGRFGPIQEVSLVMDRETGRPRGFAFVAMETKEAMEAAIRGLNGKDLGGRELTVNEARPREERPSYGGERRGGGGKAGYGGGGGGGRRW